MTLRLIVDLRHALNCWRAGERELAILRAVPGWTVDLVRDDADRARLLAAGADALWCWSADDEAVRRCPGLRWVATPAAGADYLGAGRLLDLGIIASVSHGHHARAMSEHAMGLVIALARLIHLAPEQARAGAWWRDKLDGRMIDLDGARLVIAGSGAIGREVARRAMAFGMTVTGLGRRARRDEVLGFPIVAGDGHDDALRGARVVVNLLPRHPTTDRFFDARRLGLLADPAIYVNLGRGSTHDEDAILAAVRAGRLRAGLDVTTVEPLPADSPLRQERDVLITPHASAITDDYLRRAAEQQAEQMARFAAGADLLWRLRREDLPGAAAVL